jgi:hypothetical protein
VFEFEIPAGGGRVLEILGADLAWQEDSRWMMGMLSIAQEQSRWQLALGGGSLYYLFCLRDRRS